MPAKKTKAPTKSQPDFELRNFPCNVLSRDWAGKDTLNDKIKEGVWRDRALDPEGLYRSNLAGTWHSKDNCFKTLGAEGAELQQMFAIAFAEWGGLHGLKSEIGISAVGWTMIYSDRGYATVHTHPNCHVSGVYYVDDTSQHDEITMATGVRVSPGDIEFINPMPRDFQHKSLVLNPTMKFSFKRGRMVVFPSNLSHFVHPIVGPGERIAIACNGTFMLPTTEKSK
jgi:uncharacterized protein (TIGR02466 family)